MITRMNDDGIHASSFVSTTQAGLPGAATITATGDDNKRAYRGL